MTIVQGFLTGGKCEDLGRQNISQKKYRLYSKMLTEYYRSVTIVTNPQKGLSQPSNYTLP